MAINLDRFNPSSHSNSNTQSNSKKPAIERFLTDLLEPHAPDDTDPRLPQDLVPIAEWEVLDDADVAAAAEVDEVVEAPMADAADAAEAEDETADIETEDIETIENDADAGEDRAVVANQLDPAPADQTTAAPATAGKTTAVTISPTLVRLPVPPKRGSVPKFLADFEAQRDPDDTTMRPLPYYSFNWMNENPKAWREDLANMDELDEDYVDEAGEFGAREEGDGFVSYDEADGFEAYDEYDDYDEHDDRYDDYDEFDDRAGRQRGPHRFRYAALVAGVALVSFVAGGVTSRLSSQVPVLFGQETKTTESQASYTEKNPEQTLPDQAPAPEAPAQSDPNADQAPTDQQAPTEPSDQTPNPPSYDTGDDTTDDWGNNDSWNNDGNVSDSWNSDGDNEDSWNNTDNQQDYNGQQDQQPFGDQQDYNLYDNGQQGAPEQDGSSNTWEWNFDQDGTNSISYNQDDNQVTFNYDGHALTVPIGELIGYDGNSTSSPYDNNGYGGNGSSDHQWRQDTGTGYDTEEDRDRDQWNYRPQSYIWS